MIALLGCAPDDLSTPPGSTTTPPAEIVEVRRWKTCDRVPGTGDEGAECATAVVPLDHEDPGGATYELLVKRIPSAVPARRHLWIVHGGPGASAVDDLDLLSYGIPELRPDVEVYAVDHRGIGGSGRLGCPAEADGYVSEGEWPGCVAAVEAEWGRALDHVTTTASARDLGALVDALSGGVDVTVWGGSYGTYAVLRYLHLFPDQPDAVMLEGIEHPARGFVGYDADIDGVAREVFDLCAADGDCAGHFAGEPWAAAVA